MSPLGIVCLRCRETTDPGKPHVCTRELALTLRIPMDWPAAQVEGSIKALVEAYKETDGVLVVKLPKGCTPHESELASYGINIIVNRLKAVVESRAAVAVGTSEEGGRT